MLSHSTAACVNMCKHVLSNMSPHNMLLAVTLFELYCQFSYFLQGTIIVDYQLSEQCPVFTAWDVGRFCVWTVHTCTD